MKDYFDVLENADDNTVETIEQKYPVLDEEQTEKILRMSLKKMQTANKNDDNVATVKNVHEYHTVPVEPDRRPIWRHVTGLVAAAAIVAGVVMAYSHMIEPDHKTPGTSSSQPDVSSATVSTEEIDIAEEAGKVLDKYEDFVNVFLIHDNISTSDSISFCSNPTVKFYRFQDERFANRSDLIAYAKTVFDSDYFWDNYNIVGRDITSDTPSPNGYAGYSIEQVFWSDKIPVFINYNDNLYAYYFDHTNPDLNDELSLSRLSLENYITDFTWKDEAETVDIVNKDTFIVTKDSVIVRNLCTVTETVALTVTKSEDGQWLITDVKTEILDTVKPYEEFDENSECVQIAKDLTDKYAVIMDLWEREVALDKNDVIQFTIIPTENDKKYLTEKEYQAAIEFNASMQYGTYYRCTDERFQSVADIETFIRSVLSKEWADIMVRQQLTNCFDGLSPGDEVEYNCIDHNLPVFIMYDNKLYVQGFLPNEDIFFDHWTETPIRVLYATENKIQVQREWTHPVPEHEESLSDQENSDRYVNSYVIIKDAENGEWRIDQEDQFVRNNETLLSLYSAKLYSSKLEDSSQIDD